MMYQPVHHELAASPARPHSNWQTQRSIRQSVALQSPALALKLDIPVLSRRALGTSKTTSTVDRPEKTFNADTTYTFSKQVLAIPNDVRRQATRDQPRGLCGYHAS
jgi:hypothetical protein